MTKAEERARELEMLKNVPRMDRVVENGEVVFDSVFEFRSETELFPFLLGCRLQNCTVKFQNEGLEIQPRNLNVEENMRLIMYMAIKQDTHMVEEYLRYLMKADTKGELGQ